MRLLFLQHDPLDAPGSLLEWAETRGYSVTICLICEGEPLPALDSFDFLISLGGPMGAYEEEKFPWLVQEKAFIREAVAAGKKILGLCLGCQLLADALGGSAFRHSCKEFGWQPIEPTEEGREWFSGTNSFLALEGHEKGAFLAFQWHGDTYSLPPGAVQLARNEATEQQAFLIKGSEGNQVLGLQFHLEWTEEMTRDALADLEAAPQQESSMVQSSPFVQTPEQILSDLSLFPQAKRRFFALLDRFVCS